MKNDYVPNSTADRFLRGETLSVDEYEEILNLMAAPEFAQEVTELAVKLRKKYFGKKVYVRGLIEFTNYCRNDCYYCGIRRGNRHAVRYRMNEEEILSCARQGYELGYRTFVLQGGEDPWFSTDKIASLVEKIKMTYPDCALTLSVGEHDKETYRLWKEAGADRYLLRHETAKEEHYRMLHPSSMSLAHRKNCLYWLKELGYQVGAGFMVGSPGQTRRNLAADLRFLKELEPEMIGIGPFIPHHDTCFARHEAGTVSQTLQLLSVLRVMFPQVLLPATTALGTLDPLGREKGLQVGANVVMPNLSPTDQRKKYDLYDNKICVGDDAAKCQDCLALRIKNAGYEMVSARGDHPGFA